VEPASRHDIRIGKIEQALCGDVRDANVSDVGDLAGQLLYFNVALLVCGCNGSRCWHACRKVKHGWGRDLGIDERLAVGHGAGERVPTAVDVRQYLCGRVFTLTGRLRASYAGE